MAKKFYITTPLYYANNLLHIGHAYCTIAADVLARYKRLKGKKVFFLTGTDEHGSKIEEAAKKTGKKPGDFVDEIVEKDKNLWKKLNISYDDFIRTTEERHIKTVEHIFSKLYEKGDIYKGKYEGWYCVPCESFWPVSEIENKVCPECKRELSRLSEENYFFKLSKYRSFLLKHFEENPNFIQPRIRRQEMINFVKTGLKDQSVSRPKEKVKWGISVPFDKNQIIYVWFDALINYISAIGYLQATSHKPPARIASQSDAGGQATSLKPEACSLKPETFDEIWPADVQLVGKEILRFHTVIWPAMLMALDLKLPDMVFGHGWWTVEGEKMSKTKGNVVDPNKIADEFGEDPFRYFVLREVPFGLDGNFSLGALRARYNADLANDLGNLLNRTLVMVEKYFSGEIPAPPNLNSSVVSKEEFKKDKELINLVSNLSSREEKFYPKLAFQAVLIGIWEVIKRGNKYIEEMAPWKLKGEELRKVIYNLCETLRIIAVHLYPFMPQTGRKIWEQLGINEEITFSKLQWGGLICGTKIKKGKPLFPKRELTRIQKTDESKK